MESQKTNGELRLRFTLLGALFLHAVQPCCSNRALSSLRYVACRNESMILSTTESIITKHAKPIKDGL